MQPWNNSSNNNSNKNKSEVHKNEYLKNYRNKTMSYHIIKPFYISKRHFMLYHNCITRHLTEDIEVLTDRG